MGKKKTVSSSPCGPAGLRDGTIILLTGVGGGGVGKFLHSNIVLYAATAVNNFFVSPSSCKHIFLCLHTIYFSVYSLCKQLISKFSNLHPHLVKKIMVRPKSVPWVPETFLARFPVSVKSFAARGFGLRPKMCRPSANTGNSHRTREKPL